MKYQQKLRQLNVSMFILLAMICCFLFAGREALPAYLFSETVSGEVVEYSVTRDSPSYMTASQHTPERHEVLVEYFFDDMRYWLWANGHVYSASGLLKSGDTVTVAFQSEYPEHGYLMNYALFSTLASILLPFILLILIVVTPQWLYARNKAKEERA